MTEPQEKRRVQPSGARRRASAVSASDRWTQVRRMSQVTMKASHVGKMQKKVAIVRAKSDDEKLRMVQACWRGCVCRYRLNCMKNLDPVFKLSTTLQEAAQMFRAYAADYPDFAMLQKCFKLPLANMKRNYNLRHPIPTQLQLLFLFPLRRRMWGNFDAEEMPPLSDTESVENREITPKMTITKETNVSTKTVESRPKSKDAKRVPSKTVRRKNKTFSEEEEEGISGIEIDRYQLAQHIETAGIEKELDTIDGELLALEVCGK